MFKSEILHLRMGNIFSSSVNSMSYFGLVDGLSFAGWGGNL